jgi:hypothetical protein
VSILVPCAKVERRIEVVFWSKAIQRAMGKPSVKYELRQAAFILMQAPAAVFDGRGLDDGV